MQVDNGRPLKDVVKRSIFHTVSVQQVLFCLMENDWKPDEKLQDFLVMKYRCFFQSQLAEDGFNTARRLESKNLNGQARGPAVFHALIRDRIMAGRHHYTEVQPPLSKPLGRNVSLPGSFYTVPLKLGEGRAPLDNVQGFQQTPKWYTCNPNRYCLQYADLAMLEIFGDLQGSDEWNDIEDRWLGCFLDAPILVRRKDRRTIEPTQWCFALGDLSGSASLVWPVAERVLADDPTARYFVPEPTNELHWMCITKLHDYEEMSYEWRAPAWQWSTFKNLQVYGPNIFMVVRAFPTSDASPLMQLGAGMPSGRWVCNP